MLEAPAGLRRERVELEKGPNIKSLPAFGPLAGPHLGRRSLLKVGDDISTDEILPAGRARAAVPQQHPGDQPSSLFSQVDEAFHERALPHQRERVLHRGRRNNYGQGSSREHAALAPRYLGLKAVIAKSFARIHWQNLVNFGILPLNFTDAQDYDRIRTGDELEIRDVAASLRAGTVLQVLNRTRNSTLDVVHSLSERQIDALQAGGLINAVRKRQITV